ncbi:MAG: hypothetical protein RBS40_16245 [Rhodocyclaceae bacterium]|jgi:hypothetical protein|nr:hypothetical protein [Rhodocyclaceae bacterium]
MFSQINANAAFHLANQDEDMVTVLGKFRVDGYLHDSVKLRVQEIHRHLLPDMPYSPEELLGADYWSSLSDIGQRLVTLCLENLAQQGVMQLGVACCDHCGDLRFYID